MGFGNKLKRLGRRINKEVSRWGDDIDKQATRAEEGKLFGSSVWGRYAANITGATTTARLVRRARNHEDVSPGDVVDDASRMRPTHGYSKAQDAYMKEEVEGPARAQAAAQEAARKNQLEVQRRRSRALIAARIRRTREQAPSGARPNGIGNGGLGTIRSTNSTFAALLGLDTGRSNRVTFSQVLGGG